MIAFNNFHFARYTEIAALNPFDVLGVARLKVRGGRNGSWSLFWCPGAFSGALLFGQPLGNFCF